MQTALHEITAQLQRLKAPEIRVNLDSRFEPETGVLLKVEYEDAHWHMLPQDFRNLLFELPDGAGVYVIHQAIETGVAHVWHGPSPAGSRDTSG